MENKLLTAIHWLAGSTKPDTSDAKFAKICFAVEALIGSEAKVEDLKVSSLTSMLAERAAFIGGMNFDDRLKIDKQIRKYYQKRSKIVHGETDNVTLEDIDEFGELTRRLVYALLERLDELGADLSDVNKLAEWVKRQKYTLPDNN